MKNILFITATRLGDAVLSAGLLSAILAQNPDAAITVVCGPIPAPLFRAVPGVKRIIEMKKQPFARHWWQMWRQCIGTKWDLVVDLRRSFAAQLLRGKYIALPYAQLGEHKVQHYARTLKLNPPSAPRVWLDEIARASAAAALPARKKYFAVGATANWRGKTWPPEMFIHLIQELTKPEAIFADYTPVIFGAPDEENQAAPIISTFRNFVVNAVGKFDPLTTAAALQRCAFCIGNDSGLMHLAAASGVPTLGLFGPSHAEIYGPWGPHCAYVRTEKSYKELTSARGYNHRTTGTLMESLPVEKVITAAQTLWQTVQQQARTQGAAA